MIIDGPTISGLVAPAGGDQADQLRSLIAPRLDGALVRVAAIDGTKVSVRIGRFDSAESAARADQLMALPLDGMLGAEIEPRGELRMFTSRGSVDGQPIDLVSARSVAGRHLVEVSVTDPDRGDLAAQLAAEQAGALR